MQEKSKKKSGLVNFVGSPVGLGKVCWLLMALGGELGHAAPGLSLGSFFLAGIQVEEVFGAELSGF